MREETLLPCPFCGGEPEEDAGCVSEYYGHEHQNYSISCKSCGAEVYCNVGTFDGADLPCSCHYDTRKVCVDKWNMRPTAAPAVQAEQLSVDTLANVLRNAPVAPSDNQGKKRGNSPAIPDGYALVPIRLTAENGAKELLSGEFSETKFISCPECFGDDECETCDGSGRIEITVPVSWTTIKEIWAKGVAHFAAAPKQEAE